MFMSRRIATIWREGVEMIMRVSSVFASCCVAPSFAICVWGGSGTVVSSISTVALISRVML